MQSLRAGPDRTARGQPPVSLQDRQWRAISRSWRAPAALPKVFARKQATPRGALRLGMPPASAKLLAFSYPHLIGEFSNECQTVGSGVDMARELPMAGQGSEFLAGQFLVHFPNLRGERIVRPRIANVACDLRVALHCRPNGLNLPLSLLGRLAGHKRTD